MTKAARRVTLGLACLGAVLVTGSFAPTRGDDRSSGVSRSDRDQTDPAQKKASKRRRRIIVNDDGQPQFETTSPSEYLAARFNAVVGTQVDTYMIYVGDGWHPHRDRKPAKGLGDVHQLITAESHKAGIEIIASLRMNDIHCSLDGTASPLKRQKPHLLIGEEFAFKEFSGRLEGEGAGPGGYPRGSLMAAFWAGYDYAEPEVRAHRLKRIGEIASHDYDGLELDFFRHPLFFKPGEEKANLETMTGFVRQVRQSLDRIGRDRGRAYLLAARVPDSLAFALRTGLDVAAWLDQGLLDMLIIGGGYMPHSARVKEFIDLAHRYDVPAYPSVDADTFPPSGSVFDAYLDPLTMRSVASNFWALGGDGVYVFNWYGTTYYGGKRIPKDSEKHQLMRQLGDPATLRGLNKRYLPDAGCSIDYCGYSNAPNALPVRLVDGTLIELVVGDDVATARREGTIEEMRLHTQVNRIGRNEGIVIQINGTPVPADSIKRLDTGSFSAGLTAPPLRQGINEIVILPGSGSIGRLASQVTALEVSVRYKQR